MRIMRAMDCTTLSSPAGARSSSCVKIGWASGLIVVELTSGVGMADSQTADVLGPVVFVDMKTIPADLKAGGRETGDRSSALLLSSTDGQRGGDEGVRTASDEISRRLRSRRCSHHLRIATMMRAHGGKGNGSGTIRRLCRPVVAIRQDENHDKDESGWRSTLKREFEQLDRSRTGVVGEEGLRRAAEKLRLPVSDKEVHMFAQKAGDRVTFDKFVEFATGIEDRLHATFRELDRRHIGVVSKEDIPEALRRLGITPRKVYQDDRLVSRSVGKAPSQGFGLEDLRMYLLWAKDADEVLSSRARARAAIDFGGDLDANMPLALETRAARPNLRVEPQTMRDVLAASIAGAVSRTLVAPLERMKILQMVDPSLERQDPRALLDTIQIAEGYRGLYRGNLLNVLRLFPAKAVEAAVYRALANRFDPAMTRASQAGRERHHQEGIVPKGRTGNMKETAEQGFLPDWQRNMMATVASTAGILTSHPIDTLRVATQAPIRGLGAAGAAAAATFRRSAGGLSGNGGGVGGAGASGGGIGGVGGNRRGVVDTARAILKRGGAKGFYAGIGPHVLRAVPYLFLGGYVFTSLERWYKKKVGRPDVELGPIPVVLIATAAALCAQTALYPLETVQRRLQLQAAMGPAPGRVAYSGMMDAFRDIIRREGAGALYSGLAVNNMKLLPAAAISFAIHDSARNLCDAY
ncbi:hypothetical protein CBR_g74635 [Chara braunii]|uniref:EF-hand domain-containing protein n=1 Tax=Chara braunii TaxID=69332 RepID=A0A388KA62_CHABU|nr:hypothetical protein CBR_g74635 [Chara braunii]|eukprot:GBG66948.1 hypothetical protein CBR_g74635 [Chara braunii]